MKRKHDWDGMVRLWVTEKTAHPILTQLDFLRQHGFVTPTSQKNALKFIGRRMNVAYTEVRDRAMIETQDLAAAKLGEILQRMLVLRQGQIDLALEKITAAQGKAIDLAGAELILDHGIRGMTDIVKLVTGGEPLMVTQPRKVVFDFVPVARYNKPERKKRDRKGGGKP